MRSTLEEKKMELLSLRDDNMRAERYEEPKGIMKGKSTKIFG